MNYRHSFHAGNSADVVKHSLLIALVRALQLKEGALTLIDTHAGCGLYDLDGDQAQRTGEATQGVMRVLADPSPLLNDYRAAVEAVNTGEEMRFYPGSPHVLAQLLRPQDVLILNEKHPEDAKALRRAMRRHHHRGDPGLHVAAATAPDAALGDLGVERVAVGRVRGSWLDFAGIPLMVTYHPAYLLRNQSLAIKREVWEDMLQVLERAGYPISAKQRGFFVS